MHAPCVISYQGNLYTLLDARGAAPDPGLGRVLSRSEARTLLAALTCDGAACAQARRIYAEVAHVQGISHVSNGVIMRWLIEQLHDSERAGRFALVEGQIFSPTQAKATLTPADEKEAKRIDALLAELGNRDLLHRGHNYRFVRAESAAALPERSGYEAMSERELHAVLEQIAGEPTRAERQKAALVALSASVDNARGRPALEVLLLRRARDYTRPAEERESITPSQLRQKHYIAVQAVDAAEKFVLGVALEFVLPDGSTKKAVTNDEGVARVDLTQAGSVTIRVPDIDASGWRAVGGASAMPSGKEGPARTHAVKQGECLSKIAQKYGFAKWETLWQHSKNAPLRKKRKSPHVLLPGDAVVIPGIAVGEIVRDADATHRIEVKKAEDKVTVCVVFRTPDGKALEGQAYELRWGDEPEPKASGNLSGSGQLKERVPSSVAQVEILLTERGEHYALAVSSLNPARENDGTFLPSGVSSRLYSLGYLHRPLREATAEACRAAIHEFQRVAMKRAEPSGELDIATCQKLEELYGI